MASPAFRFWRINRVSRLHGYINALVDTSQIKDKKDLEKIQLLREKMNKYVINIRMLTGLRFFFYLIIYASIATQYMKTLSLPTELIKPFLIFSALIGGTLAILIVMGISRSINLFWEDIRTMSSHIIAIVVRHEHVAPEEFEKFIKGM